MKFKAISFLIVITFIIGCSESTLPPPPEVIIETIEVEVEKEVPRKIITKPQVNEPKINLLEFYDVGLVNKSTANVRIVNNSAKKIESIDFKCTYNDGRCWEDISKKVILEPFESVTVDFKISERCNFTDTEYRAVKIVYADGSSIEGIDILLSKGERKKITLDKEFEKKLLQLLENNKKQN